jgi:UPF0176 protein
MTESDAKKNSQNPWHVVAFYRFVKVVDCAHHQKILKDFAKKFDLCGTILIAPEGFNGTIASQDSGAAQVIAYLTEQFQIDQGEVKWSHASDKPFARYKVRLKKEIITLRNPLVDPTTHVGTYVEPKDWNDLISDPEILVLDTRNKYETKIGSFAGAIDPNIDVFTQFDPYVSENLDPKKHKKIAMFCTGGIRCEKASALMLQKGFQDVYHLKGGILKYLEEIPKEESLWQGECFVFDKRVGLDHGLNEGSIEVCYGCREPLSDADKQSPQFEEGVSCPFCFDRSSEQVKANRRMRHLHILQNEEKRRAQLSGQSS